MKIPIQDKRKMALQTLALRMLYATGTIGIALLAPKLTRLLPHPDRSKSRRKELYGRIAMARSTLKQRGLVEERDGKLYLTDKGRTHIEKILLREYHIPPPVHWDGKWRILMFDIREERRGKRFYLRKLLRGAGFVLLQDSVWVHPYPCDEFVTLIRAHLASGVGELRQVTANALESDRSLREHFDLVF